MRKSVNETSAVVEVCRHVIKDACAVLRSSIAGRAWWLGTMGSGGSVQRVKTVYLDVNGKDVSVSERVSFVSRA